MRLHILFIYIASFLLLVACGSTTGTTSNDTVASTEKKAPDEDYDGVPNDVDQCPYIFGTARTFGCPDADGDGIKDSEDRCPDEKGYANLLGCIDRDYDGVIDPDDECPDAYGERETGCPDIDPSDVDGDGIKNEEDECPELRGLFTANGCPDGDGDGTKDELDACPDLFGVPEHNGCPLAIGDMMELARLNGHPAKVNGIAEKGYYKSYDGKLYDRNDMRVDVVSGDIVDQNGTFITATQGFNIDRKGYIRDANDGIVRIDEEGYAFSPDGLLSKKQVNNAESGGGIKFGKGTIPSQKKDGINYTPQGGSNDNISSGGYDPSNIYNNPRNEQELTPAESANCNRINLQTLTAAIYFDYDASKANNSSLRQLNRVVDAMQKCAKLELQVGGYADSDGSENYNYKLSEKRAKSVLKYIMGQGISDKRLKYNAYGEKYPLSDNSTDEGKQQNRRAEIQVTRK
ncbi:OmpA family protein [Aureispira anguillae]|uniref:OmpA family protein n=1 Tax=Aureispira anguillae TaxID=2864201 RepID=A0A915YK20_9BACT|nr:OmpA family protein [Aureispira anguillae]BDS14654.1 OmpA family protein [Aureispira anguillae]